LPARQNNQMESQSKPIARFARWRRRAAAAFLVLAAILLVYVADTICHANFHVVVDGEVYRAGQMNAGQLARVIQNYQIKSIVNLRGQSTADWYQGEMETAEKFGVRHYDFALSASREVSGEQMAEIIQTLRAAPKPVLIHCKAGADRTGLVSALYCLAVKGEKPATADRELSVWFGHLPLGRTLAMDNSFWHYVNNSNAPAGLFISHK
jgi:protein tyrosine/serine phosphatase